jgi:hypothetical protein
MDNPIVRKGRDGWEAKSRFDFDGDYKLTIETSKSGGRMVSLASVSLHRDGCMSHSFAFGAGGDYSERLIVRDTRATEKSVAAQHNEALAMLENVRAAAKAHYAKHPIPEHRK